MEKDIYYSLTSYLILFSGLIIGFFFFSLFAYNRSLQVLTGILMSVYYLGWGITHHLVKKTLTLKVIAEYLLISILAVVILSTLLLRA